MTMRERFVGVTALVRSFFFFFFLLLTDTLVESKEGLLLAIHLQISENEQNRHFIIGVIVLE